MLGSQDFSRFQYQTVIKEIATPATGTIGAFHHADHRKIPVWQQESPILDFYTGQQNWWYWSLASFPLYSPISGQWRPRQTLGSRTRTMPCDMRGRVGRCAARDHVFLSGARCSGKLSASIARLPCQYIPGRSVKAGCVLQSHAENFFKRPAGRTKRGSVKSRRFFGATWKSGEQRVWLFTGTDGHTRLFSK